jgi:hypothetical protein
MSGDGPHVTKLFTVSPPWRIKYEAKGHDNVTAYACSSDGQEGDLLINEVAPKSGVVYPEDPIENGYIKINFDGPWHLVIEQK